MEEKACVKCGEIKNLDSYVRKKSSRDGRSHQCKACDKVYKKSYYKKNRESILAEQKVYREENKESIKAYLKDWVRLNREYLAEYRKRYYEENPDKHAEMLDRVSEWQKANKTKMSEYRKTSANRNRERKREQSKIYRYRYRVKRTAYASLRKARKMQATPTWANPQKIEGFYETSQGLSMILGEWYHVDHIVPLTSDYVCGLHCEHNLRVITATENLSKNNRWWPDMWEPVPLEEITNGF